MDLTTRERRALGIYRGDIGCSTAEGCPFCGAFVAGMRGKPRPDTHDGDVLEAWRAGAKRKSRPKKQPNP